VAGLEITPESMHKSATDLDAVKDQIQALIDKFNGKVEEYADAFGGDEIGSLLGIAHEACTGALNDCFTTNIEELVQYGQNIREMADDHQATDDEIAKGFEQLLGELGR
jgi:uncharacterized protein YukE